MTEDTSPKPTHAYTCTGCKRSMIRKSKCVKEYFADTCFRCDGNIQFDDWRNEREKDEPAPGFRHGVPPLGWIPPQVAHRKWERFYTQETTVLSNVDTVADTVADSTEDTSPKPTHAYACVGCNRTMFRKIKCIKGNFANMCFRCEGNIQFDDWRNEHEQYEPAPGFRHGVPPLGWIPPQRAYVTWAKFYVPGTFMSCPYDFNYIVIPIFIVNCS